MPRSALKDKQERARTYGYFTGKASLTWLRKECRYESMGKLCAVTRFLFARMFPRTIYQFRQDRADPLTFHCPDGTEVQPWDQETDNGSVPRLLQPVIADDDFPKSFWCHDYGYGTNGLWCRHVLNIGGMVHDWLPVSAVMPATEFHFVRFTRAQCDKMLCCLVGAEGGLAVHRQAIYQAVNLLGWSYWRRHNGVPARE